MVHQAPTHNSTHKTYCTVAFTPTTGRNSPLCSPCFITVFLGVEIQRRLNFRVTQDALNSLGFNFRLVHQPVAQAVTQVVESNLFPSSICTLACLAAGRR